LLYNALVVQQVCCTTSALGDREGYVKNIVGKPVQGPDFFGRERELEQLKEDARSQHILLLAPRRVGKTSLLLALAQQLTKDGELTATYASVAAATDELDFLRLVSEAIYETPAGRSLRPGFLSRWASRRHHRVKKVGAAGATVELEAIARPWQPAADAFFRQLLEQRQPWLLMIDELPTLILSLARLDPTGARVAAFLHWFRGLRQLPAAAGKLHFVLAGSIGLDNITRHFQLTAAINDLLDWRLGPYDEATADRFLAALAAATGVPLAAELRRKILDESEWFIPYHLQAIFSELRKRLGGRAPEPRDLDAVLEDLLTRKVYFSSWDERLTATFGAAHEPLARVVLGRCAARPGGVKLETLESALAQHLAEPAERLAARRFILDVLQHDGYLVCHDDRWRFRSGLLRRYWQRNCA
jgi:DNA polymerase III delta prime subunit